MRRGLSALTLLVLAVSLVLPGKVVPHVLAQTGSWVAKAPIPIARTAAAAVTGNDGRIYVFGGSDNATRDFSDSEVYAPSTNTWSRIAPLPVAEAYMSAQLGNDGKIYIFGGFDNVAGRSLNTVFAYDPASNTYACSGSYSGCASTSLAPMPTARSTMAIAMMDDGRIWTIGGYTTAPVATVEIYDPATNTWQEGPPLPSPDAGATAFSWLGSIMVNGGFDGQQDVSTTYIYSSPLPRAAFARHGLPAGPPELTYPPALWFCNGNDPAASLKWVGEHISDPYWYRMYEHKWTGTYDVAREYLRFLKGQALTYQQFEEIIGEICVNYFYSQGGGLKAQSRLASALDAAASSVSLPSVIYVGGVDSSGVTSSVGNYDWFHGTVTAGPTLPGPRELAAVTYDDNGTVYVIGGDDGQAAYNTVLTYTPPLITVPLPSPTVTPTSAATATPLPTSTPIPPTATATSLPLFVRVSLAHKTVAVGKNQTVVVKTLSGAHVSVRVAYPNGKKAHHTATANGQGRATWTYKQPAGVTQGKRRSVKITVSASDSAGATAKAQTTYTIR